MGRLKGRLAPLLELESGSNDPMAVFLTIAVMQIVAGTSPSAGWVVGGFVAQMHPVMTRSLILLTTAGCLMFVARPVSVFLTLWPSTLTLREKTMVAWVGLRGAVPIILATFPLLAGVPNADHIFDLVFFVVLTSVLFQGPSIPTVARWPGVDAPVPAPTQERLERRH